MAENTSIEWCDHTFNPWSGCTKVSPGCLHCYAESLSKRNPKTLGVWGAGQPRQRMSEKYRQQPLKWNDAPRVGVCQRCGTPWRGPAEGEYYCDGDGIRGCGGDIVFRRPRVFCASLADWLDDEVPIEWLADLLDLIRRTPNLDWLLLTKRPQNWNKRICGALGKSPTTEFLLWLEGWFIHNASPANVWIGTTVEDQTRADERIPQLLSIPARLRFLSCEPLLSPLLIKWWLGGNHESGNRPDWVIVGGESGPGARPMHPDWARKLRDDCAEAGVPFLFKQWGEWAPFAERFDRQFEPEQVLYSYPDGHMKPIGRGHKPSDTLLYRVGKKAAGRLLDGREHNEFPAVATAALVNA